MTDLHDKEKGKKLCKCRHQYKTHFFEPDSGCSDKKCECLGYEPSLQDIHKEWFDNNLNKATTPPTQEKTMEWEKVVITEYYSKKDHTYLGRSIEGNRPEINGETEALASSQDSFRRKVEEELINKDTHSTLKKREAQRIKLHNLLSK